MGAGVESMHVYQVSQTLSLPWTVGRWLAQKLYFLFDLAMVKVPCVFVLALVLAFVLAFVLVFRSFAVRRIPQVRIHARTHTHTHKHTHKHSHPHTHTHTTPAPTLTPTRTRAGSDSNPTTCAIGHL